MVHFWFPSFKCSFPLQNIFKFLHIVLPQYIGQVLDSSFCYYAFYTSCVMPLCNLAGREGIHVLWTHSSTFFQNYCIWISPVFNLKQFFLYLDNDVFIQEPMSYNICSPPEIYSQFCAFLCTIKYFEPYYIYLVLVLS